MIFVPLWLEQLSKDDLIDVGTPILSSINEKHCNVVVKNALVQYEPSNACTVVLLLVLLIR